MAIEIEGAMGVSNGTNAQSASTPIGDPYNDPTFKHGFFETDLPKHFLSGRIVARVREEDGEVAARIVDANEPWAVDGDRAVATGISEYKNADGSFKTRYYNVFLLRFDEDGRCSSFIEYFVELPERLTPS